MRRDGPPLEPPLELGLESSLQECLKHYIVQGQTCLFQILDRDCRIGDANGGDLFLMGSLAPRHSDASAMRCWLPIAGAVGQGKRQRLSRY